MDEFISLIVAIGIIFSGIGKIIEKFSSNEADDNRSAGRTGQNKIPEKKLAVDKDELWAPVYEDNNYSMKEGQSTETANPSLQEIKMGFKANTDLMKSDNRKKRNRAIKTGHNKKRNRQKEKKKDIFHGGLAEDDLIKGIIFKEILDAPRSRSPYKSVIEDRYN